MIEVGNKVTLVKDIIESATGDHPSFIMGYKGEEVEIISIGVGMIYPYEVLGPTNNPLTWRANADDFTAGTN